MRQFRLLIASLAACALVPTASTTPALGQHSSSGADRAATKAKKPQLRVRTVVAQLDYPWDLDFLPSGAMLYTERDRKRIWWRSPGGTERVVADSPAGIWASGETGLMSILVAPSFKQSRAFWTCHGAVHQGNTDVRVVRWRLNPGSTHARRVDVVVKGIPAVTGRHAGCRMRLGPNGAMYVGTGDAAVATNPQNKHSLGGKVLRVNPWTGHAIRGNPFIHSPKLKTRKVFTYGHRNVQGLALRANGQMWSMEHGTDRDDEANLLRPGGNYGWDPGPGYDESAPMTDFSLPGRQIGARWSSGYPTDATSGIVWMEGRKWGVWNHTLAVAALKDSSLRFLKFTPAGTFVRVWKPPALDGRYGRLRSVVLGPRDNLYITTGNGGGADRILRVRPIS